MRRWRITHEPRCSNSGRDLARRQDCSVKWPKLLRHGGRICLRRPDGWPGWTPGKADPERTNEQRQNGATQLSTHRLRPRKTIRTKRLKRSKREKDVKLSAYEKRGLSFSGRDWVALHDMMPLFNII